jgi:hypothetical protein
MKKFIFTAFTATTFLFPFTSVFAAPLTISLGIPQERTFRNAHFQKITKMEVK